MNKTIVVRFVAPGFHSWPDAHEARAYLRSRHRHLFHLEVRCAVKHNEREIEFHDLLEHAEGLFRNVVGGQNASSCETMAEQMCMRLRMTFGRPFVVSVFEDGECGAICEDA